MHREHAAAILDAALAAADPRTAVRHVMRRDGDLLRVQSQAYDLRAIHRVRVVGFGKASGPMAQATEEVLGDKLDCGWVNVKAGHAAPLKTAKIRQFDAGHPLPDENSLLGTRRIIELLEGATEDDLVVCLVSGGGSALLELPPEGVSLADLRAMNDLLLRSGATIREVNILRKHISEVKGGRLALRAKGRIIALILSDVVGSQLDAVASGPTAPDPTTYADVQRVIERYKWYDRLPPSVLRHFGRGVRHEIPDTPKAAEPAFGRVQNVIIADNAIACDAALQKARSLGYNAILMSTCLEGEARDAAAAFSSVARDVIDSSRPVARPACIIAGGETTVTVRGSGAGGRNQEFALAAAIAVAGLENVLLLSAGTDGTDGTTDAAGALCDGSTIARARALGLDAEAMLANNDAYNFFKPLNDLVILGPTGTNVNDLMMVLAG